ncbi:MAG: hypothetical protein COY09_02570 [Candidatus Portnoybacteria bacterium CG_4_10_14_0_2_um_filter_39_11]|uniref:STAS domain-containing protein n=1 Tax=Candidatus Portnoybacteria bacterium CG_4_10_14_0_2_um_filter_39_11 TaxID=1974797 RepID=A0A2M7UHB6_9BACT|nr:MAG: hypothetical protein AUJ33_02690 [Parcubacteria group bacterium CG1_02_40_25]PIZ70605.1 MAG: hypothetical protein COY09_02570 [Candidatus Portnoybacteria bacterium CG_4_10_14_0_2_um_filter_39_11]
MVEEMSRNIPPKVILDFGDVSEFDNAGLGVLISSYTMVKKREGKLLFVARQGELTYLLAITKLTRIFEIFDTVEAAMIVFEI